MNYNKKSDKPINLMLFCLKAAITGILVFLFSTLVFALILTYTDISDSIIKILSYISVVLSSYITSFIAIKLIKKSTMVTALISGIFVFIFIVILKFIFASSNAFGVNILILLALTLAVSMSNAIILINKKKKIR